MSFEENIYFKKSRNTMPNNVMTAQPADFEQVKYHRDNLSKEI